jgi:hypothetical protein
MSSPRRVEAARRGSVAHSLRIIRRAADRPQHRQEFAWGAEAAGFQHGRRHGGQRFQFSVGSARR